jgi:hypothetical protein
LEVGRPLLMRSRACALFHCVLPLALSYLSGLWGPHYSSHTKGEPRCDSVMRRGRVRSSSSRSIPPGYAGRHTAAPFTCVHTARRALLHIRRSSSATMQISEEVVRATFLRVSCSVYVSELPVLDGLQCITHSCSDCMCYRR